MPRGACFDDLLDEQLAAEPVDHTPAVSVGPAGMATAYGFFFVDAPRGAMTSAVRSERRIGWTGSADREFSVDGRFAGAMSADSVRVRRQVTTEPAPQPSGRKRRAVWQLQERERRAFAELVALGGALREDFTFDELRSVFRTLARRYHPDRHAGCNEHRKAGLAEQFTRAREAYQVLASHVLRVH